MKVKDGLLVLALIALIALSVFGVERVITRYKMFQKQYWQSEIKEEKNKRIRILDRLEKFKEDNAYSPEELEKILTGIGLSTMGFNYMDTDQGDVRAYEVPFSPGFDLMGSLNLKYLDIWDDKEIENLASNIQKAITAEQTVKSGDVLWQSINRKINEIKSVYTSSELSKEDLSKATFQTNQSKWMASSVGGFLGGVFLFLTVTLLYEVLVKGKTLKEAL